MERNITTYTSAFSANLEAIFNAIGKGKNSVMLCIATTKNVKHFFFSIKYFWLKKI
jgi:hypothetical protein